MGGGGDQDQIIVCAIEINVVGLLPRAKEGLLPTIPGWNDIHIHPS